MQSAEQGAGPPEEGAVKVLLDQNWGREGRDELGSWLVRVLVAVLGFVGDAMLSGQVGFS